MKISSFGLGVINALLVPIILGPIIAVIYMIPEPLLLALTILYLLPFIIPLALIDGFYWGKHKEPITIGAFIGLVLIPIGLFVSLWVFVGAMLSGL